MGNKAILMSIQPKWVAKILNGEKTIEVRKNFPKDYVGWVYIYCTKGKRNGDNWLRKYPFCLSKNIYQVQDDNFNALNGYVVARFWCDKVEEIMQAKLDNGVGYDYIYDTDTLLAQDFGKKCCLNNWDLLNYFGYKHPNGEIVGYAIHISRLEIFDKPRDINEFYTRNLYTNVDNMFTDEKQLDDGTWVRPLKKAPQSWCYIEDTLWKYFSNI